LPLTLAKANSCFDWGNTITVVTRVEVSYNGCGSYSWSAIGLYGYDSMTTYNITAEVILYDSCCNSATIIAAPATVTTK
jgi:hypothetical protein